MPLTIQIRDRRRETVEQLGDDAQESFRRMCQDAPDHALRRGVMQHGDTMFNSLQLYRLVEELENLPAEHTTASVQNVLAAASRAIRLSGYLYFVGD